MARGRPSKAGKRTKSGRLKREQYPTPIYDRGSDWVQRMRAKFGEHYSSALGRAYASGLLGDGDEGKVRLDAAKRFVRIYERFVGGESYRCPLNDAPRGGNVVSLDVSEHQVRDYRWLMAAMDSMDVAGVRPWFDQLVSSLHVDRGPYWLDNLLDGQADDRDVMVLEAAIQALDIIAPARPVKKIVVQHY